MDITYGTALGNGQLDASTSVPGTLVYTPSTGTVLSVGTHTLDVSFIPDDSANYTTASATALINVTQATPTIIGKNPANIIYGTALCDTQLDATS